MRFSKYIKITIRYGNTDGIRPVLPSLVQSELAQSNKLDTFKAVNKVFNFEKKYISCISIEKHRVALSRFRYSAHKMMIKEGRYRNIERNNRLCQYCQMNVIEDEFHFLLVCPAYRHLEFRYCLNIIVDGLLNKSFHNY